MDKDKDMGLNLDNLLGLLEPRRDFTLTVTSDLRNDAYILADYFAHETIRCKYRCNVDVVRGPLKSTWMLSYKE